MLTPEQIEELKTESDALMDDVIDYLFEDIIRTIQEAGKITGSAEYKIWLLRRFGVNNENIKAGLNEHLTGVSDNMDTLIEKAAKTSYFGDISALETVAKPFEENEELQQLISGIKSVCHNNFDNITGTAGFIKYDGAFESLTDAYRKSSDYAFRMTSSGAMSYDEAVKSATKNLINKGILSVDYESGITTDIGAAVRKNVISSVGNLTNEISQKNHDELGATGWEISAHFACAADHEDIQGKQYTDKEYEALNAGLIRHIGTLNCGHIAFPIFYGKSSPVHSDTELREMKEKNEEGVSYKGVHYTTYEATQKQRQIERSIRKQKRRNSCYKLTGDTDSLQNGKTRYIQLTKLYREFSDTCGLKMQKNRL